MLLCKYSCNTGTLRMTVLTMDFGQDQTLGHLVSCLSDQKLTPCLMRRQHSKRMAIEY